MSAVRVEREDSVAVLIIDNPPVNAASWEVRNGLLAAVQSACADPALRAKLGKAGRRAYEAEFTEPIVVSRYRRFFDRVTD